MSGESSVNVGATARQYATMAGVDPSQHIDVPNDVEPEQPEEVVDTREAGDPDVESTEGQDPDELTEEQLEAATNPEADSADGDPFPGLDN